MKADELSFVNLQLAGMLKSGIPLEASLKQICENMRAGQLREELRLLEADLAAGVPLNDAIAKRQLPELYIQMIRVGAKSNNLPGVLTLMADYYERLNSLWTRLKGLLVYPLIVVASAFVVSTVLAIIYSRFIGELGEALSETVFSSKKTMSMGALIFSAWLPAVVLGLAATLIVGVLALPPLRRVLRWKIPGFKEVKLWQTASAFNLLLDKGCTFGEAVDFVSALEKSTPAAKELAAWKSAQVQGVGSFAKVAPYGKAFPPFFRWLVVGGGENLATGFKNAADVYYQRALYRIEVMLYSVLPVSAIMLGGLVLMQIAPLVALFKTMMSATDTLD
jgi:type IV pilus assembly protein PilC